MKLYNPFRFLSRFEWILWGCSMAVVLLSFWIGGQEGILSLIASLIGVTALILVSKGDVLGQVLGILFGLLYAIVSFEQRYYGEMFTYLLMGIPSSVASLVSWVKNPHATDRSEVKMTHLCRADYIWLTVLTPLVTFVFYWILRALGTAALLTSTLSIATSFFASFLMFRRSPYYALAYAVNDAVLIVLWCIAAEHDPAAFSMIACFLMFLVNDFYGLFNWLRLRRVQKESGTKGNLVN